MTHFFDKTLTIYRERVLSGDRTAFSATSTSWSLSLQPFGEERTEEEPGYAVKQFSAYVDVSCPATEGDQLIVDGNTYLVKGVSVYDTGGLAHKKLKVTQKTGEV